MLKELLLRKRTKAAKASAEEDKRPVKFVPDGENSWRVVWADTKQDYAKAK